MKKLVLAAGVLALCLTSCTTTRKTAASVDVSTILKSETQADLDIQEQRITYTVRPPKTIRRGGKENVRAYAVSEALKANGQGDVLVEAQYEMRVRHGLFGKKIKSVTVTGYPAKYKNFQKAH